VSSFWRAKWTDHRRVVSCGRVHHCGAAEKLAGKRHLVNSKGSIDCSKSIERLRGLGWSWWRVRWWRWQKRRLIADWSSHSLLVLNRLVVVMVVVDSLNGQNLDWACDDLNRLVHELARIGEDHCLSRSAGFRISKLDDDSVIRLGHSRSHSQIAPLSIIHHVDDRLSVVLSWKAAKTNRVLAILSSLDMARDFIRCPVDFHVVHGQSLGNHFLEIFFRAVEGKRLEVDVCFVAEFFLCILRSVWSDLIVNLGDKLFRYICRKTWQFGFEVDKEELLRRFWNGDFWRDGGALFDVEAHGGSYGGEDLPQVVFYLIEGVKVVALAQRPNLDVNVRLGFDLAFHVSSSLEGVWHESECLTAALN